MRSPTVGLRALLCSAWLLGAFLLPGSAAAQEGDVRAMDAVYDAADAIDEAKTHYAAGDRIEGDRALTRAEEHLSLAERIAPGLPAIRYERARLQQADGEPGLAEETLGALMRGELPVVEHMRAVQLLDSVRSDLGKASLGVEWRRANTARDVGLVLAGAGAVVGLVGVALGFGSYADDSYDDRIRTKIALNRAGWGLALGGAAAAGAGAGLTLGAQVQVSRLHSILPGPWRLQAAAGGPLGAEVLVVATLRPRALH